MTPEEARLALEAARKAGHVGRLAWEKLCLYYQAEAIVTLVMVVVGHALLSAALIYALRQPFGVEFTRTTKEYGQVTSLCERVPTKWIAISILLGIAWTTSVVQALAPLPKVIATIAVPELRAAVAVAAFTSGKAVP